MNELKTLENLIEQYEAEANNELMKSIDAKEGIQQAVFERASNRSLELAKAMTDVYNIEAHKLLFDNNENYTLSCFNSRLIKQSTKDLYKLLLR